MVHDSCYSYQNDFEQTKGNHVTIFHLILLNKACKAAIKAKNDNDIDLKFQIKFLPNANKPKKLINYDLGSHSTSVDMPLVSVFQKNFFH